MSDAGDNAKTFVGDLANAARENPISTALIGMGLFWLFVYDASMLLANGQILAGVAITLLLVCAIASFFGIRMLSRSMAAGKVGYRVERGVPAVGPS